MFLTDFNATDYILPIILGISIGLLIAFKRNSGSYKLIYLDAEEFRSNMRKGQLIDIRSKEDFTQEKINGSRNFPKREVLQSLHLLRKDQPIFIYGNTDKGQIKSVGKKLMKKGFKPVYVLVGGLDNWPFVKK
jgi:rhodanese-related sulfurtransferase